MKELPSTPAGSAYTGPERRWMTRSLYDWTDRDEHHDNKFALKEAREIAVLERIRQRAIKASRDEENIVLYGCIWDIQKKLNERRKRIADDAAPWFDERAFQ
jgi:hypothetical protein